MARILTDRQREILSITIETADSRRIAEILDVAYVTLRNHFEEIKERLNLEDHFIEFGSVPIHSYFIHKRKRFQRVPHATDKLGGYNAQDESGKRTLFQHYDIVERTKSNEES